MGLADVKASDGTCPLVHTRCGACGVAITAAGTCGCDGVLHPIGAITADQISKLRTENKRLRLERDVLALNWGERGVPIQMAFDGAGEVVAVGWDANTTASEQQVRLPSYAKD